LPICRYFRARRRHVRHASHARGRRFETRRAHPEKRRLAGTLSQPPVPQFARSTPSGRTPRVGPRGRRAERARRASSRLTRERSPVEASHAVAASDNMPLAWVPTWKAAATALLPPCPEMWERRRGRFARRRTPGSRAQQASRGLGGDARKQPKAAARGLVRPADTGLTSRGMQEWTAGRLCKRRGRGWRPGGCAGAV